VRRRERGARSGRSRGTEDRDNLQTAASEEEADIRLGARHHPGTTTRAVEIKADSIAPPRNTFDVGQKVVSDIARHDDGEAADLLGLDQTLNDRQVFTGFDDAGNLVLLGPLTS
jgi:hypothetical protein